MPQLSTTGNLANAQRIVIAQVRYTEEHSTPAMQLIEHMKLGKGEKQVTVPKIGQMSMQDLVEGQDLVDEQEIGMTTVDLTVHEVGMKIILTDVLVDQSQPSVFGMIGRQMGDGNARKKDQDVIALYPGLNGGTSLGNAAAAMSAANFAAAIANAKGKTSNPFTPSYAVHHPHAVYAYTSSATAIGSANHWPEEFQKDRLAKFYSNKTFNGVSLFEDGNIEADASDDGIGVIAAKDALVVLSSVMQKVERERDASLRGTEVVMTARYGVFELDDTKGFPLTFDIAAPSTSA